MSLRSLSLFAALALAGVALAGPPGLAPEGPDPAQHLDRLAKALDLDADQTAAIGGILEQARKDGDAARDEIRATLERLREAREQGDEKAMRKGLDKLDDQIEAAEAIRGDVRDAIRGELTLEQQVGLALLDAERHRRMEAMREGARPPRGELTPPGR